MKTKKQIMIGITALFVLVLSGCSCKHETWLDATCTTPKTCADCGETEGEALGHQWIDATCTEPKTCSVCGETEGKALGHKWVDATCTEPKTCSVCGETEGKALGHTPGEWTIGIEATKDKKGLKRQYCSICKKEIDSKLYELPPSESNPEYSYKKDCEIVGYADLYLNPEQYNKKNVCINGWLYKTTKIGNGAILVVCATYNTGEKENPLTVVYTGDTSKLDNLIGKEIYIYGESGGISETNSYPIIYAEYIN